MALISAAGSHRGMVTALQKARELYCICSSIYKFREELNDREGRTYCTPVDNKNLNLKT